MARDFVQLDLFSWNAVSENTSVQDVGWRGGEKKVNIG